MWKFVPTQCMQSKLFGIMPPIGGSMQIDAVIGSMQEVKLFPVEYNGIIINSIFR